MSKATVSNIDVPAIRRAAEEVRQRIMDILESIPPHSSEQTYMVVDVSRVRSAQYGHLDTSGSGLKVGGRSRQRLRLMGLAEKTLHCGLTIIEAVSSRPASQTASSWSRRGE